ncbi:MAG: NADH-quinone oxidoreductase subunit N [Solirubrobacterales bacterium]
MTADALISIGAATSPPIEYETLLPFIALAGGAVLTLIVSMFPGRFVQRSLTPLVATSALIASLVLFAIQLNEPSERLLSGSLRIDDLAVVFSLLIVSAALVASVLAWRGTTVREAGSGEIYALLLSAVLGMTLLVASQNLVTLFLALELFSIPLYVLCGADLRRNRSLESGVKYLIIGSLGSVTMLYGLAFVFGATGSTGYAEIGKAIATGNLADDTLLLVGVGLTLVGVAFKASIAPFHQWTPDVYEGAPTPVTTFMSVATKAATFGLLLRLTGEAFLPLYNDWAPLLAVLATVTILVGNLGALGQESLKRMLAYSGVAQAGYLLVGVAVGTALGARATVFYLLVYLLMNVGPFAVIISRERAGLGDGLTGMRNLGREAPVMAWSMTISMITLAGLPITAGFVGKLFLIESAVDGGYAWLAVVLVLGSALSLAYYLRVVAAMWMSPGVKLSGRKTQVAAVAGAASDGGARRFPELVAVAVLAALASIVIGVWPQPLLDLATDAAEAFFSLSN